MPKNKRKGVKNMLLVMCILFLLYNLRYLRKGRVFAETVDSVTMRIIEIKESKLSDGPIDTSEEGETAITLLLLSLFSIGILITELITFACLLDHDAYKWPTAFCIILTLAQLFKQKVKSSWLTKEELIVAKAEVLQRTPHTWRGVFSAIVHCVYYGYMILILTNFILL